MHGYQIMQELAERSRGVWQPSPGSVYPTLQLLEDEGLVRAEESEGRRVYHLAEEGRRHVESRPRPGHPGQPPWEAASGAVGSALFEFRDLAFRVGAAVMQVARAGSEEQVERAERILAETRGEIYRLLAEGDAWRSDDERNLVDLVRRVTGARVDAHHRLAVRRLRQTEHHARGRVGPCRVERDALLVLDGEVGIVSLPQ